MLSSTREIRELVSVNEEVVWEKICRQKPTKPRTGVLSGNSCFEKLVPNKTKSMEKAAQENINNTMQVLEPEDENLEYDSNGSKNKDKSTSQELIAEVPNLFVGVSSRYWRNVTLNCKYLG